MMKNRSLLHPSAEAFQKIAMIFLLSLMPALWTGCPSNHTAGVSSSIPKRIDEILVSEDDQFWYCTIKGVGNLSLRLRWH